MATQYNLGKVVGSNAKINGYESISIVQGNGISVTNENGVFTIAATEYGHASNTNNPHSVTKEQVGLGNVENMTPADILGQLSTDSAPAANSTKPVQSGGVYTALGDKANKVSSATPGHVATLTSSGDLADSGYFPGQVPVNPADTTNLNLWIET